MNICFRQHSDSNHFCIKNLIKVGEGGVGGAGGGEGRGSGGREGGGGGAGGGVK